MEYRGGDKSEIQISKDKKSEDDKENVNILTIKGIATRGQLMTSQTRKNHEWMNGWKNYEWMKKPWIYLKIKMKKFFWEEKIVKLS